MQREGGTRAHSGEDPGLVRALREHAARFRATFGAAGAAVRAFFSPGRVNLMGAHLDYNGGPVMPMAIDRGTFFALRARDDRRVRFASTHEKGVLELDLARLPEARSGRWSDYPLGVARILAARGNSAARSSSAARNLDRSGFDALFGGNLPVGAGLSSSASICVGTAFALDRTWELGIEPREQVEIALRAEREFVGVRCGIMDPFSVGLARSHSLLWLDCKDASYEHVPFDHETLAVAVADSGVRRELAQSAFNQRVAEAAEAFERLRPHASGATVLRDVPRETFERCERDLPPAIARRARHVVEEVARTFAAREDLHRGDVARFGSRMFESHRSLRDLYEVSVPELDCLVEAAERSPGVLGARLTGAGFGGCVVALVRRASSDPALEQIADAFEARFGRRPSVQLYGGDAGPREIELDG